jgi:hypothetical protein
MGASCQLHSPALLHPGERTHVTHWIGGWVGPEPNWTLQGRETFLTTAGNRTPAVKPAVHSLYRLSYPGSKINRYKLIRSHNYTYALTWIGTLHLKKRGQRRRIWDGRNAGLNRRHGARVDQALIRIGEHLLYYPLRVTVWTQSFEESCLRRKKIIVKLEPKFFTKNIVELFWET